MKALILAGGLGERLRPYTEKVPKPLLEVAGKPILFWQIEWLKKHNVDSIVLAVGYLGEKIEETIGDGSQFGVKVDYSYEKEKLGTGGAIKNAKSYLEDTKKFFVINGDIITNINLTKLSDKVENGVLGGIAVVPLPSPYGIIKFDETTGVIRSFVEKPKLPDYWINAGIYILKKEIFDMLPDKGDIEKTAFPKLAEEKKLIAVPFNDVYWKSVDTHKDIKEAARILKENGVVD